MRAYLVDRSNGKPIFPLRHDKGAAMVQIDLAGAGIDYEDASGRFFDFHFHSLRCELATLADAARVSPRVFQRMMRHSQLEMTGRDTRPRAVDIEAAAAMLPSLKPETVQAVERAIMTGTDSTPTLISDTPENTTEPNVYAFKPVVSELLTSHPIRNVNPFVEGSSPSPVTWDNSVYNSVLVDLELALEQIARAPVV
jgi:hypothetical protein